MRAPVDRLNFVERHLKFANEPRRHVSEGKVDAAPPRRLRLAEAIFHAHNFEVTAAVEERELADPFVQRGHGRKQGRGALDVDDAADVAFIIARRLLDAALPKFRPGPFYTLRRHS